MHWWQIRKRGADLERELRYDLELEEEEQREKGLSAEEARYAARRAFGNPTLIREQTHEAWGTAQFERFWQDVHYALRQMRRSPGFTLVVVLTMALGIAATTTMFTVVYSTLLRSLPYPQSERIVAIHDTRIAGRSAGGLMTGSRFYDIEARNRSFSSLAIFYFDHSADARAGIQCERRRAPCPANRGVELSRMAAAFRRRSEHNRRTGEAGSADGDDCGRDAARFFCAGRRGPLARGAVYSE